VVQGKARSAVHRLWNLGCWSYRLSIAEHRVVLVQIQRSDNIFSMGSDIMRPAENFVWGCSANWRGVDQRTCLVDKGIQMGQKWRREVGLESFGIPLVGLSISL